jgi:hypothetical protein
MNAKPPCMRRASVQGALIAALMMALMAGTTRADTILPSVDYDTIAVGVLVAGPHLSDFITPKGADMGDLLGNVYYNEDTDLYTYEMTVTPTVDNIKEWSAGFDVLGFNGVAGYSYSDSAAAGGAGDSTDFSVHLDPDGSIDWETNRSNFFFDANESITFFFQSTLPPTEFKAYTIINGKQGMASNFAPGREGPGQVIPVPAALPAGLALLGLCGLARRRRVV